MKIEIIGSYDEIAWYSNKVGKTFEVLEVASKKHDYAGENDVKVKKGNGKYSYWVNSSDYKVVIKK